VEERIQCAAVRIRKGEDKFILMGGYRHSDIMLNLVLLGIRERVSNEDQGFMTSTGRFVDRKEAALIAESAGQLIREIGSQLYSEDLY
jgi:hypothetical protein